ncbi:MAG: glycosyltransferase [Ktedonobacteraceae bacterium]|nr:glycosyltransferase [Ktedonobacteraceae bacterium]
MVDEKQLRVCIVGAGKRFLGGLSYYTLHLTNALARSHRVSAILMRQLLPTRFYPGWKRVGADLAHLEYDPAVQVFDGVDWYWLPSMFRCLLFFKRERPGVVVFQWWSGTVLHSYLLLAFVARMLKARVVIEFHEVQDPGEAKLPVAQMYVRLVAPLLVKLAHGFVVHSEYDKKLLQQHYALQARPIQLIPHGPYDRYQLQDAGQIQRAAPPACCNLLFFGLIRPYKGLDDLIKAFEVVAEQEADRYWLTIVGEIWEGWTEPANLINQSRYRERITFINRYVSDAEVSHYFAGADALVLPYHYSSSSGPLHIAMSCGLPVVVTAVGGLIEAVTEYEGAILIPPEDPAALQQALQQVAKMAGKRYSDPCSWERNSARFQELFDALSSKDSASCVKTQELAPMASHERR